MLVYMEAHPIVLDALFATITLGSIALGSTAICRSIDKTKMEILRGVQSRNDLLKEGFQALASLLSNRPCIQKGANIVEDNLPVEKIGEAKEDTNGRDD